MNSSTEVISVYILAYNHEKYISKCLDSILDQVVNVPFKIIIGEDCSTDNTRQIILRYKEREPSKIEIITSSKNIGAIQNSIQTLAACKGDFIAFCEGDDFWIDSSKLQCQYDLLKSNEKYKLCYSNFIIVDNQNKVINDHRMNKMKVDQFDVLAGFCPKLSTVMIKNNPILCNMPGVYQEVTFGDHFLFSLILQNGLGIGSTNYWAAYRVSSVGTYSQLSNEKRLELIIRNYLVMQQYFKTKMQRKAIEIGIVNIKTKLFLYHFFNRDIVQFFHYAIQLFIFDIRRVKVRSINAFFLLIREIAKKTCHKFFG